MSEPEGDPTRMAWVLDNFEQELLWTLNFAEFLIAEEVEELIAWRFDITVRRAIAFSTYRIGRLTPKYTVYEGFLPLDEQNRDAQIAQTLDELRAAGKDEHRIRLIAKTSMMRTFNTAAHKRYKAFGFLEYRYLAQPGACTDPKELSDGTIVEGGCTELHNQVFSIDDEAHIAPIHPDCRCTIVPVLPKGEEK